MLKHNKITTEQLNDQIKHLSQLPMPLLKQYEDDLLKKADTNKEKGLEKTASKDAVETVLVIPASTRVDRGQSGSLIDNLQSLMTLSKRNSEYERIKKDHGDLDVFR